MNQASTSDQLVAQPGAPPVVNIKTRVTSKQSSEPRKAEEGPEQPSAREDMKTPVKTAPEKSEHTEVVSSRQNVMYKAQGPIANELPFGDYVSRSGLKGAKRNQIGNISKTINDRKSKVMRMINKDSANPLP